MLVTHLRRYRRRDRNPLPPPQNVPPLHNLHALRVHRLDDFNGESPLCQRTKNEEQLGCNRCAILHLCLLALLQYWE